MSDTIVGLLGLVTIVAIVVTLFKSKICSNKRAAFCSCFNYKNSV